MKLCKDCEHCDAHNGWYWAKCHHPLTNSVDAVTGVSKGRYCESEREWGWLQSRLGSPRCGKEARWFKPKKTS